MNSKYFLFIDDDPQELEILNGALKDMSDNVIVRYAVNGVDGLALLDKDYKEGIIPSLVILDLNMPKMNGSQTLESLKAVSTFQHIPVIIYSTSLNTYEKDKCLSMGAHSYLTKPISYKETLDTVEYFLKVAGTGKA